MSTAKSITILAGSSGKSKYAIEPGSSVATAKANVFQ